MSVRRGGERSGAASSSLPIFPAFFARFALFASPLLSCGGANRDVVPESHDVVRHGSGPARGPEGYDYVARRPLAVVALAEARGIEAVTARAAVDRLADRLDACVTEEARSGGPIEGAARVVARIADNGDVAATNVRIDPGAGAGAAQSAVVCLVSPLKLLTFPPAEGAAERGIAIEALWGQLQVSPPSR